MQMGKQLTGSSPINVGLEAHCMGIVHKVSWFMQLSRVRVVFVGDSFQVWKRVEFSDHCTYHSLMRQFSSWLYLFTRVGLVNSQHYPTPVGQVGNCARCHFESEERPQQ